MSASAAPPHPLVATPQYTQQPWPAAAAAQMLLPPPGLAQPHP